MTDKEKKDFVKDIAICTLIIVLIEISDRYFPNSIIMKVFIIIIGVVYFGGNLLKFANKWWHKLKKDNK